MMPLNWDLIILENLAVSPRLCFRVDTIRNRRSQIRISFFLKRKTFSRNGQGPVQECAYLVPKLGMGVAVTVPLAGDNP